MAIVLTAMVWALPSKAGTAEPGARGQDKDSATGAEVSSTTLVTVESKSLRGTRDRDMIAFIKGGRRALPQGLVSHVVWIKGNEIKLANRISS